MAADPLTEFTVDSLLGDEAAFDTDDDLFNDKAAQNAARDDKTTLSPRKRKAIDQDPFANADEEVKIVKQRKKIPKLDADRLLSDPGIPKIRSLIRSGHLKKKLRLKGKGHEFSDIARLLNYYQTWLDQLYPRAKFADALQLVEKAGHTKKMQMYRKAWIDESKPGYIRQDDLQEAVSRAEDTRPNAETTIRQSVNEPIQEVEEDPASLFFGGGTLENRGTMDGPDDDELDALLAQETAAPQPAKTSQNVFDESEGEDDLDALLAQESIPKPQTQVRHDQDDQDELDALLEAENTAVRPQSNSEPQEDPDELDALLSIHNAPASEPELPALNSMNHKTKEPVPVDNTAVPGSEEVPELDNMVSSSPIPNIRTDELDDLMDEHDATLKRKQIESQDFEAIVSSSPLRNEDSQ